MRSSFGTSTQVIRTGQSRPPILFVVDLYAIGPKRLTESSQINALAVSPDKKYIAAAGSCFKGSQFYHFVL